MTDVLAIESGRWVFSKSARGAWAPLNGRLRKDVASLFIADLDNNGIDDLIQLDKSLEYTDPRTGSALVGAHEYYRWFVSEDGRGEWRELASYLWRQPSPQAGRAFAGRFGVAPGGGVLLTGPDRFGYFYAPGETRWGREPAWTSLFEY